MSNTEELKVLEIQLRMTSTCFLFCHATEHYDRLSQIPQWILASFWCYKILQHINPCTPQGFQNKAPHDASVGYLSKFGRSAVATFPRMIQENI